MQGKYGGPEGGALQQPLCQEESEDDVLRRQVVVVGLRSHYGHYPHLQHNARWWKGKELLTSF